MNEDPDVGAGTRAEVKTASSKPHRASFNIVVFTGRLDYSVVKGIVDIDESLDASLSWLIVVHEPAKHIGRLIRNQWGNLRRNGWRWIPYQAQDVFARLLNSRGEGADPNRPGSKFTRAALDLRKNVRVSRVGDIHGAASVEAVEAFAPDLGLSMAAPILKRRLFAIPRHGTLNLHKGQLPEYRGMPPAFWELWNDEDHVGCTVHRVDDKLDMGGVVRAVRVGRQPYATLRGLQLELDEVGIGLMRQAAHDVLTGSAITVEQTGQGRTYRKPTLGQVAVLHEKFRHVRHPEKRSVRQVSKAALLGTVFNLFRWGGRRIISPRITVLLYHRVSDSARDNLTVGIEQFDRQMALIAKHCRVLPLEEVLATRAIDRSDRPLVAITFDDGYLDNCEHAVPILLRHGLPAAFFVSTGMIGGDGRFPHDDARGNSRIPTMSWHHLRFMREAGFSIGSHTVSHIDCAAETENVVWDELVRSREVLQQGLGVSQPVFAYPYGGRKNMTPERLELVKRAGYAGCLSAYGGSNIRAVDRYNVVRCGIHWEFTDQALLFECLGLG